MVAKVIIPQDVDDELRNIGDQIEAEAGSATALNFVNKLSERCLSLDHFPNRGSQYQGQYRRLIEEPYQIIYRVHEVGEETTVYIVTVRHMSRNTPKL